MKQADWFYTTVVYSLDIRSFRDSNADGIGDINGLIEKMDYLAELGVGCIWLAPFFKSKEYDDGYDVMDYYQIDPRLGSMEDFTELVEKARSLGIRIILDLVVNHTSIHHPWFERAVKDPDSRFYDYYLWTKEKPENHAIDVMFPGVEDSNWAFEPQADAYYYHTFYDHQADLNVANPHVQQEIRNILHFWMGKGIAGFRVDAVPKILKEKAGMRFEGDPFDILNGWRDTVKIHDEEAVLIGEADVEPENYTRFLEPGRLTALFNFYINNYTFLSLAAENGAHLAHTLRELPLDENEHYLTFLRNHDELDLGILDKENRLFLFEKFAPEETMRIYGRGIRRRFAPMLDNDPDRMILALSLLFSLPGTPVLRYGEEIGMGEDLNLPERRSVRTAMQWSSESNAGFSEVTPQALRYPLIREGAFGYKTINVADQHTDKHSLLSQVKRKIRTRQEYISWFGFGQFNVWSEPDDQVLCLGYEQVEGVLVCFYNFSRESRLIRLPDSLREKAPDADTFELGRYGYLWLLIKDGRWTKIGGN